MRSLAVPKFPLGNLICILFPIDALCKTLGDVRGSTCRAQRFYAPMTVFR
jgi:hypothetical protein